MPDDVRPIAFEDHPLAAIFPLLPEPELLALADDIRENGLRDDIMLFEGKILDGRNRYRACLVADVRPRTVTYNPKLDGADALAFVISRNLRRRHLDESQRAMVAARVATMRQGERTDLPSKEGKLSQSDAASLLNVSRASVERAAVVQRQGVPELGEAVERGEIAVTAAAEIARKPEPEQRQIVRRPTASEARKIAQKTGQPVIARDGREYDGKTLEQERAETAQNQVHFQVIEAIEALASITVSPADYIASLPADKGSGRYLDELIDEHLEAATAWFAEFNRLWEASRGSR